MLKELAALVRNGSVSPVELVQRSLDRIEASRGLNAVTALWAEDALREAAAHPRTGVLAGLPVLVKDMVRIEGRRTTFGSTLFAD
ncbi:MAG: amidase family protein, partial [Acidimicrobiales bacterium]